MTGMLLRSPGAGNAVAQGVNGHWIALIPALNEAASIAAVLDRLAEASTVDEIVVIDDGSTDDTARIADDHGATTLRLPFNLGVGGAVRLGLRYAVAHGADGVVIMDADGQHVPADVGALVRAVTPSSNMVVGSRFADPGSAYAMQRGRRTAHHLLNWATRRVSGFATTDATSGFRAFDGDVARLLAEKYPVEFFADTVEVLLIVRDAGFNITETPVAMLPRQGGAPSQRAGGLMFHYVRVLVGVLGAAFFGRARPGSKRPSRQR